MPDFETAFEQWREGERRVHDETGPLHRILMDVQFAVLAELRRRLGGPFSTEELVDLYEQGTDWCVEIAQNVAPDDPAAWDARLACDAAFAHYVRGARDFAGGRRL